MATLKFGKTTSNDGFTPLSTANFNDLPPARIVRELIQNSLDAAVVEGGQATAIMHFQVDDAPRRGIPDLKGYKNAFRKAVEHQTKLNDGELPDAAREVADRIQGGLEHIDGGQAKLLSVMDNGVGLDSKRMNALLADGASSKSASSSGSYGVGHLAPMALSDIRYVLYGGLTQDGKRIASGKVILAPHPSRTHLNDAKGYLINKFQSGLDGNLYEFLGPAEQPKLLKDRLDFIDSQYGHGCAVLIPAFNNFRNSNMPLWDIISKIAAYNFAPAIHGGILVISVSEGDGEKRLDSNSLQSILEQDHDRTRAARSDSFFGGLRPSGQNAYSILQAIQVGAEHRLSVNGDKMSVRLLLPSLSGYPRIDLFRNGMWVTDNIPGLAQSEFANRQPFHAVLDIEAQSGGELHRVIRKAEGVMHDSLAVTRLSHPEQSRLEQCIREISRWIKEQVPAIATDEYTVDDFLLVNTADNGIKGRESFSYWGTPVAVSRRSNAQVTQVQVPGDIEVEFQPDEPRPDPKPGPKPPRPRKPTRPLPFRSTLIPNGDRQLVGSIASSKDFSETWLAIRVDENADFTCDRIWQDEDVRVQTCQLTPVNGDTPAPQTEIVDGGRFVKIQGIVADAVYRVEVEYQAIPELSTIVDSPILRLELHRPASPHTSRPTATKEGATDGQDGD